MPSTHPTIKGLIIDLNSPAGYVIYGRYMAGGALPTDASSFAVGCELIGPDGTHYINRGTVASPSWKSVTTSA